MDSNLQTSFIPKRPMQGATSFKSPVTVNIFSLIAITIFVVAILASGGLYFYNRLLQKNISDMQSQLETAKNSFDSSVVSKLQNVSNRIASANELLSSHISVSPVLDIIGKYTLKSVRFRSFNYNLKDGDITITMKGEAKSFSSVAVQADEFAKSPELKNPILSNYNLDGNGNVIFDFTAMVDKNSILYKKMLTSANEPIVVTEIVTPSIIASSTEPSI
jgi:hypothetical protein